MAAEQKRKHPRRFSCSSPLPGIDGLKLIMQEAEHQTEKWGLEHDVLEHGSERLVAAAEILLMPEGACPDPDASTIPWAVELRRKHHDNVVRRCMIAGALCAAAIDAVTYEAGREVRSGVLDG